MNLTRFFAVLSVFIASVAVGGCQMFPGASTAAFSPLAPFNGLPAQSEPELGTESLEANGGFDSPSQGDLSQLDEADSRFDSDFSENSSGLSLPVTDARPAITDEHAAIPNDTTASGQSADGLKL